jgi:integrase
MFLRRKGLIPPVNPSIERGADGAWPSGKASVFGTVYRRFESYRPSQQRHPTRDELYAAVRRFYEDEVQADLDERAYEPDLVRQNLRSNPSRYRTYAEQIRKEMADLDNSHVADDLQNLLAYESFTLDGNDTLRAELGQLLMRARLEAARRWAEHDTAIFDQEPADRFFRIAAPNRVPDQNNSAAGKPLSALFEGYAVARASALKTNTIDDCRKTVHRFSEFVGMARPAKEVERPEARAWRDLLRSWPQYASQAAVFSGLDFKAVLEKNKQVGKEPITLRTANKYLADMSSFFDWLVKEDHVSRNIFEGLTFERRKDEQKTYPFTSRQIDRLLASPLLLGSSGDQSMPDIARTGTCMIRDWRYWILLLGLFTGARQGEIAQIELRDISSADGIDFIHITNQGEGSGKSVKASYSKRRVPVHSRLIEFGFMDYVAERRTNGDMMLFPALKRDSRGYFSTVSKFYQKYFDAIGLRQMEPVATNFHSFRHSFIDELRRSHQQDNEFKSLLGHAGKGVTSGYGISEVLGLPLRQSLVESVIYPAIDFSRALWAAPKTV